MRSDPLAAEPLIRKRQNQQNSSEDRNEMEARAEHQTKQRFKLLYEISLLIGATLAALVLVWCIYFRGGFAWQTNPAKEFNLHPLLMVLGMICLYSQSILIFRTGRNLPKKKLKLIHMTLNLLAFTSAVVGLKAAFDSHNLVNTPIPNLYTMHSWIGLLTIIFFAGQFLVGFTGFLFPGYPSEVRAALLPIHTSTGTAIFFLAVVSCMTGIMEKAIWAIEDYKLRTPESYTVNFMGVCLVVFGALVLYLVNAPEYKRISLAEDQINLGNHSE